MKHSRLHRSASESGATFVEATISVSIFLAVVFGIVDLSRYLSMILLLNHALQQGVDLASKLEIELPTTQRDCQLPSPNNCDKYTARLNEIISRTANLAHTVVQPSSATSGSRLVAHSHFTDSPQTSLPILNADVAFVRPGEEVFSECHTNSPSCVNELEKFEIASRPFSVGWPTQGESWAMLLRAHPFALRLKVKFDFVTPFFPDLEVPLVQYGYRYSKSGSRAYGAVPPPLQAVPTREPTPIPPINQIPDPTPEYACSCCDQNPIPAGCSLTACYTYCESAG